jgi:lia operon protein LiaG
MRIMAWVLAALVAAPVSGQEVQRVQGDDVAVYDLAGHVQLVRGSGSDVVVRIQRGGADSASLHVETGEIAGRPTLRVIFPGDEIVYPAMGRGSNSTLSVRDDGTFGGDRGGRGNRGDRVRVRGSGSGREAWADLVIEVPSGRRVSAYVGVGRMEARGVQGDLGLHASSGGASAEDITGALDIESGSGGVDVRNVRGTVRVNTGSGGIDAASLTGDKIDLQTGSGSVDADSLQTPSLSIDTGSGRVSARRVSAPDVLVDTGSGGVDLELLTDVDRLDIDTGSGGVVVHAPANLGATVEIDNGSGGIDLDFPLEVRSVRRDRVEGRLGDGKGTIRIQTGSGGIKILHLAN